MSKKLKIALPKGSLQDSTVELFRKAGYNVYVSSRGYRPTCDDDDLELFLIRAQEIGRYGKTVSSTAALPGATGFMKPGRTWKC